MEKFSERKWNLVGLSGVKGNWKKNIRGNEKKIKEMYENQRKSLKEVEKIREMK